MRLLLVGDEPAPAAMVRAALAGEGVAVDVADTGAGLPRRW